MRPSVFSSWSHLNNVLLDWHWIHFEANSIGHVVHDDVHRWTAMQTAIRAIISVTRPRRRDLICKISEQHWGLPCLLSLLALNIMACWWTKPDPCIIIGVARLKFTPRHFYTLPIVVAMMIIDEAFTYCCTTPAIHFLHIFKSATLQKKLSILLRRRRRGQKQQRRPSSIGCWVIHEENTQLSEKTPALVLSTQHTCA